MDKSKPVTNVLDNESLNKIELTKAILSTKPITEDSHLVTYNKRVSKDICEQFNVDYSEAVINDLLDKKSNRVGNFYDVSIAISAAITAYARIHITKIKLDILAKGGNIYYSDTDSIVTDIELSDSLVHSSEIGKLKLEHSVKRGYFISPKLYCLVLEDDSLVNKSKGHSAKYLNESLYQKLLNGETVKGIRTETIRNHEYGSVIIKDREIDIGGKSLDKRDFLKTSEPEEKFEFSLLMHEINVLTIELLGPN